jgi:ABC-type transport system involved in multi-copper enzyme maturation permease subunit
MICIAASSYFHRTIAALVVSYLVILPLSLVGVLIYSALEMAAGWRLMMLCGVIPLACLLVSLRLFTLTARRLLHPPDVGAEAQEVIDPELEQKAAVGLVIQSDQFPDKLFVPARRTNLLPDGVNPIYDKEMRSEIFGQGTLMLRLVIQLSMFLALPLMAVCFYIAYRLAPWYVAYVLLFNMLVGPVFSAGAVSGERERQTLDLLLTTILSPWQILSGKLLSSLRISGVLTSFLLWPLLLAWLLPPGTYWGDTPTILGYLAIIVLCSITTSLIGLGCSVVFRKTSVSMMTAYLVIILLFAVPPAVQLFAQLFFPEAAGTGGIEQWAFTSPFSAVFSLPLTLPGAERAVAAAGQGEIVAAFFAFYLTVDAALLLAMVALFRRRGRHWVA